MPSLRRNDPCHCGSGRKYKSCCMRQDQVTESRALGLSREEGLIVSVLYNHAMTQRFAADFAEGFGIYWGGAYDLGQVEEFDSEDLRRTLEWFVHDYHTHHDAKYVIDLVSEDQSTDIPQEVRETLDAWSQSVCGLYRIIAIQDAQSLALYDCLRQEELEVIDPPFARNARQGDLIIGRVFVEDDSNHLSMMSMLLPPEYETGLTQYVQNAYEYYLGDHPGAPWDEFLRENGHIYSAYLLSSQAESLRALIGPGTRYHDPAVSRDKLRQWTQQAKEQEQREQMQARRGTGPQPARPQLSRTETGIILPGQAAPEPSDQPDEPAQDNRPHILIPGRDL